MAGETLYQVLTEETSGGETPIIGLRRLAHESGLAEEWKNWLLRLIAKIELACGPERGYIRDDYADTALAAILRTRTDWHARSEILARMCEVNRLST